MANAISRRALLRGAIAVGTSAGLGAAIVTSRGEAPKRGFLGRMERWNEHFERLLFDPNRLAPELPESALTVEGAFPAYRLSTMVPITPAGFRLEVGGLVARPRAFTLEELMRLPRTDTRVRHHCVEGWTAVAGWHGVRLRDLAAAVGVDRAAGYVEFRSFDAGYWSTPCRRRLASPRPQRPPPPSSRRHRCCRPSL